MRNRITASTTVRCVELYCCCAVRLIKCNGRAKKTRPLHNLLTINTQEENQRFRTIMEMCRKCGISVEFFHNKCVDYPNSFRVYRFPISMFSYMAFGVKGGN